jgi:hypothetical protein
MANDRHQLILPVENATSPAIESGRIGTVITVDITDTGIADVIGAGFNRAVLERSDDVGLTWHEITSPDQRPALSADKQTYRMIDRRGDAAFLYRTRYMNTDPKFDEDPLSEPSEPIVGAGLALRGLLSVEDLIDRYFFGVDLTNDQNQRMKDSTFQHYILAAIRGLETDLDIAILPTQFSEDHDYHRDDYNEFCFLQLDNYPVISVDDFTIQYPSGQTVVTFPTEWFRLDKTHGHLQIVATAGTISNFVVGAGGSFLPALGYGMESLPQLFHVTYTAGFGRGQCPRDIIEVIGMGASMGPLNIFGDMLGGAGIASLSLSLDGISQSVNTTSSPEFTGYGARIKDYRDQIHAKIKSLRAYFKGVRGTAA